VRCARTHQQFGDGQQQMAAAAVTSVTAMGLDTVQMSYVQVWSSEMKESYEFMENASLQDLTQLQTGGDRGSARKSAYKSTTAAASRSIVEGVAETSVTSHPSASTAAASRSIVEGGRSKNGIPDQCSQLRRPAVASLKDIHASTPSSPKGVLNCGAGQRYHREFDIGNKLIIVEGWPRRILKRC